MRAGPEHEGYLIEFRPAGQSVQVTAIDPLTGLEVSIVGPASAQQRDLIQLVVRKLNRALGVDRQRAELPEASPPPARRGILT